MQLDFLEPLLSAQDAIRADQFTIDSLGISGSELMERAGLAVAHKVETLLQTQNNLSPVPVVVVCGPGNNGGDGWVTARRLWQNGIRAAVLSLADAQQLHGEAKVAAQQFLAAASNEGWSLPNLDPCVQNVSSGKQSTQLFNQYRPHVVIDAIFGTGLKRPADGLFAETIQALNAYKSRSQNRCHVLAIDIPSGLPSDGQLWSAVHIVADSTLAIQFRKISHLCGAFIDACGEVSCVDIGIQLPVAPTARALLAGEQPLLSLLHVPPRNSYKGQFGHVGVLFGSNGIQGASALCAYSALRSGAGLVTLLIPSTAKVETLIVPEVMRKILPSPLDKDTLERFTSLAIGTGVNQSRYEVANEILAFALNHSVPTVVDAGALPLLKTIPQNISTKSQIIATPHPGEAARLLNSSAIELEKDRIETARALLEYSSQIPCDVTWVLKGAYPIIAHNLHGLIVCEGGISTLSIGGSGDVLTGLCAALFAQTDSGFNAALLGVSAHLEAGRRLMHIKSRGFLAHEIADAASAVLFGTRKGLLGT